MGARKVAYDEWRKKRLEENKQRIIELNLNQLAQSLHSLSPKPAPKHSPAKPRTSESKLLAFPTRRSARVASLPAADYKELSFEPLERSKRVYNRGYSRPDILNRIYASAEERAHATEKAQELDLTLHQKFPTFIKPMLQSHVTGGFWLGLPLQFCRSHLGRSDKVMTLEDEDGNESETKYLGEKSGLSAGWRGFAIDHELVDGDALVFQLTNPNRFKVYIIRVYRPEDGDETRGSHKRVKCGDGQE